MTGASSFAASGHGKATLILCEVAAKHEITRDELESGKRRKSLRKPRNEAAFRIYKETNLSQPWIAAALSMSDHTAIRHMIISHAKSIGVTIFRVRELRDGQQASAIDWTLFGYAVAAWLLRAGLTQDAASKLCSVSRASIRKAQNGEPLDADTYILIREGGGLSETDYVRLPGASRETPVKHTMRGTAHG